MSVPVFFPIEVTSRELEARLLLAAWSVGEGRSVFLGQDRLIYRLARRWNGGVYVGKQVLVGGRKPNLAKYRELKERGYRVLFQAEEEPVFSREEEIDRVQFLQMFHPDWLDAGDVVCAWGGQSADIFRAAAGPNPPRIEVTGHPRFDICKPEFSALYQSETDSIRRRFGRFILLNTKFALASNAPAYASIKDSFGSGDGIGEGPEYWLRFHCYHGRMQAAYISLANTLRKAFPDMTIVLRPHPGEDPLWYKLVLEGMDRVHVLTEGSVLPWLSAAAIMVHTGCTTALEGCGLTPRIIQFAPESGFDFDHYLPSLVGSLCHTEDEVVEAVKSDPAPALTSGVVASVSRVVANFENGVVACERMGSLISEAAGQQVSRVKRGALAELEHHARSLVPPRRRSALATGIPQKFEKFKRRELEEKLTIAGRLAGRALELRHISPYLVEIRAQA